MKRKIRFTWLAGIILLLVSCGPQTTEPEAGVDSISPTVAAVEEIVRAQDRSGVIMQWAVAAEASSEFSDPEWSAEQALGWPDSPGCGDYQFAWASAASDSIDTLILEYPRPVFPLEIVIHQSFNPDQVTKVEVFNTDTGGFYTVLQKNPIQIDRPCPYELVVSVDEIDFLTNQIRITLDQSQLGLGWNEIDAVQLIGLIDQP